MKNKTIPLDCLTIQHPKGKFIMYFDKEKEIIKKIKEEMKKYEKDDIILKINNKILDEKSIKNIKSFNNQTIIVEKKNNIKKIVR